MEALPPLRWDIDLVPFSHEGRELLLVRDSLGLAEPDLALNAAIAPCLAFFDGSSTLHDLQEALTREQGGVLIPVERLESLVEQLDRFCLLQTDRYREARQAVVDQFAGLDERPAVLAGSAYPGEPGPLAALIDEILALAGTEDADVPAQEPCAVAAPHIDLKVSGPTYGIAYRTLRSRTPSALLLLGTGHSLEKPFSLTDKTFSTPLGKVPSDKETVRLLREAGGGAVAGDDFVHRSEHSLEFQLLFLQRLYAMENIPVVPVLCGTLEPFMASGRDPLDDPAVGAFVGALRKWLGEDREGRLAVAGVDLAHVGPKFGDGVDARSLEKRFRASDGEVLAALEGGDAGAFFRTVARGGNRFRICGFSALWTLLAALPGVRGQVLDYRVWHEAPTRSAVSFAAVSFTCTSEA